MKITIEIGMGNAAMQTWGDVAVALKRLMLNLVHSRVPRLGDEYPVMGANGNKVGELQVDED